MELIYNLAFALFILGLFLSIKNNDQKTFWVGITCLVIAVVIWIGATNTEVTHNLIGVHVIKDTQTEYIVELHYFNLKSQALDYYKEQQITDFSLIYRLAGDTRHFFRQIGGEKQTKIKRIKFTPSQQQRKSAFEVYQDFFIKSNLLPEYNSQKPN